MKRDKLAVVLYCGKKVVVGERVCVRAREMERVRVRERGKVGSMCV